ncbi:putative ribonuclease H protein At1g65750 family [Senna tora]|uniref:Putative ribonuclease H protein At1g65750 family n=1 Tax=Senna tora TaxID=362788 RepID=A0A835C9Z0_9FABA|nr:putative ribonuclease H protein At1g65750 family [Senna tora]
MPSIGPSGLKWLGPSTRTSKLLFNKFGMREAPNNNSYVWRSIMKATAPLKAGFCRRIRNGRDTNFWLNNWIGGKPFIEPLDLDAADDINTDLRVSDFIRDNNWQLDSVRNIIPVDMLNLIRGVPLPRLSSSVDVTVSCYDTSSIYSAKSGFNFVFNSTQVSSGEVDWKWI